VAWDSARCTLGLAALRTQAERDWAQSEAGTFIYDWTTVSAAKAVAWLAVEGRVQATVGGQALSFPARLTAVSGGF
jgi:hypothetical protein